MSKWDRTVVYLKERIKKFEVKNKEDSWFQVLLGKLMFYSSYSEMWTSLYPKVWKPKGRIKDYRTLQHEGVHLIDAQTFYGKVKAYPALKWISVATFSFLYLFPQILFLLSLLAIGGNLWWLLCLLFLLPLPAPGRMMAEIRAYRRTVEIDSRTIESIVENFVKKDYYFMWPFPKHVKILLLKSSPYRNEMDKILRND